MYDTDDEHKFHQTGGEDSQLWFKWTYNSGKQKVQECKSKTDFVKTYAQDCAYRKKYDLSDNKIIRICNRPSEEGDAKKFKDIVTIGTTFNKRIYENQYQQIFADMRDNWSEIDFFVYHENQYRLKYHSSH